MSDPSDLAELVNYLARSSRLSTAEATRLVGDVLAFLDETPEAFVRRRHRALQAQGLGNAAIFERLTNEIAARRFRGPDYSARQLRRIIYG